MKKTVIQPTEEQIKNRAKIISNFCYYFPLLHAEEILHALGQQIISSQDTPNIALEFIISRADFWQKIYQQLQGRQDGAALPDIVPMLDALEQNVDLVDNNEFMQKLLSAITSFMSRINSTAISEHLQNYPTKARFYFQQTHLEALAAFNKQDLNQSPQEGLLSNLNKYIIAIKATLIRLDHFIASRKNYYEGLCEILLDHKCEQAEIALARMALMTVNDKELGFDYCKKTLQVLSNLGMLFNHRPIPAPCMLPPNTTPSELDLKYVDSHWLLLLQNFTPEDIEKIQKQATSGIDFTQDGALISAINKSGVTIPKKMPGYYLPNIKLEDFQQYISNSIKFLLIITQAHNSSMLPADSLDTSDNMPYKPTALEGINGEQLGCYWLLEIVLAARESFRNSLESSNKKEALWQCFKADGNFAAFMDVLGYQGLITALSKGFADPGLGLQLEEGRKLGHYNFIEIFLLFAIHRTKYFTSGCINPDNDLLNAIAQTSEKMIELTVITRYLVPQFFLISLGYEPNEKLSLEGAIKFANILMDYADAIRKLIIKKTSNSNVNDSQLITEMQGFVNDNIPIWISEIARFVLEYTQLKNSMQPTTKSKKKRRKQEPPATFQSLQNLLKRAIDSEYWYTVLQLIAIEDWPPMIKLYPRPYAKLLATLLHEKSKAPQDEDGIKSPLLEILLQNCGHLYRTNYPAYGQETIREITILHLAVLNIANGKWGFDMLSLILDNKQTWQLIGHNSSQGTVFHTITKIIGTTVANMKDPKTGHIFTQNQQAPGTRQKRVERLTHLFEMYKLFTTLYKKVFSTNKSPNELKHNRLYPSDHLKPLRKLLSSEKTAIYNDEVRKLIEGLNTLIPKKTSSLGSLDPRKLSAGIFSRDKDEAETEPPAKVEEEEESEEEEEGEEEKEAAFFEKPKTPPPGKKSEKSCDVTEPRMDGV